jgi:hypothetical protein
MLVHARMKRALLAVALVATTSGVASAGGYLGLGLGTSPSVSGDSGEFDSAGRSARLIGGFHFGRFGVEGSIGGFDAQEKLQASWYPSKVYLASISGKYNLPLSDGFEAYGRVGLQRTWFSIENDDRFDASGNGLIAGVGMEYKLDLKATAASIWLDYQYSRASLDGELTKSSLSARMWTIGFSIGF